MFQYLQFRVNPVAQFADDVETPPNRERVLVSDLRSDTSGEGLETALVATDASRGGVRLGSRSSRIGAGGTKLARTRPWLASVRIIQLVDAWDARARPATDVVAVEPIDAACCDLQN